MKIITCASYGGSGSSALTDLVAEYKDVKQLSDYEFRFLYDPDGISDLEFNLVECHNRHNAGRALKRFLRLCEFNSGTSFHNRYEPFFNNKYLTYSKEYVDELTDFTNKEWWFYDLLDKGEKYYYFMRSVDKILRTLSFGKRRIMQNEITLFTHPTEERFIAATRDYVHKLMVAANTDNLPFLEIDQIVPSQNIDRYIRYFSDDISVFVVDRDPRDIYLLQKLYWGGKDYNNVNTFIQKYKYERNSGDKNKSTSSNIVYIKFEDLVYRYQEMVRIIEKATGLDDSSHLKKFEFFNPRRSVHNTRVWLDHPEYKQDIEMIEHELSEFLYNYEGIDTCNIEGHEVTDNSRF